MLIWGKWEEEYFLRKVWTGQITLKAFGNFLSARISNLPAFSAAGGNCSQITNVSNRETVEHPATGCRTAPAQHPGKQQRRSSGI
jgi:hypothetical protein